MSLLSPDATSAPEREREPFDSPHGTRLAQGLRSRKADLKVGLYRLELKVGLYRLELKVGLYRLELKVGLHREGVVSCFEKPFGS